MKNRGDDKHNNQSPGEEDIMHHARTPADRTKLSHLGIIATRFRITVYQSTFSHKLLTLNQTHQ